MFEGDRLQTDASTEAVCLDVGRLRARLQDLQQLAEVAGRPVCPGDGQDETGRGLEPRPKKADNVAVVWRVE